MQNSPCITCSAGFPSQNSPTDSSDEAKFPAAAGTFECALQIPLSQEGTSNLNMLLRRTLLDAGLATYAAKDKYQRALPFVAEKTSTCTAAKDAALAKDGSYPSGHASLGWA